MHLGIGVATTTAQSPTNFRIGSEYDGFDPDGSQPDALSVIVSKSTGVAIWGNSVYSKAHWIKGLVTNCGFLQCAFPGSYGFGVLQQGTWKHDCTLPVKRSSP